MRTGENGKASLTWWETHLEHSKPMVLNMSIVKQKKATRCLTFFSFFYNLIFWHFQTIFTHSCSDFLPICFKPIPLFLFFFLNRVCFFFPIRHGLDGWLWKWWVSHRNKNVRRVCLATSPGHCPGCPGGRYGPVYRAAVIQEEEFFFFAEKRDFIPFLAGMVSLREECPCLKPKEIKICNCLAKNQENSRRGVSWSTTRSAIIW